jgi:hypothetical protein
MIRIKVVQIKTKIRIKVKVSKEYFKNNLTK